MSLISDLEQFLSDDNAGYPWKQDGDCVNHLSYLVDVAKSAIALEDFLSKVAGGPDAPVQIKCTGEHSDIYMSQMAELFNNLHDALEKVR